MISRLDDDPLVVELRARIQVRIQGLAGAISRNTCKDFAEYKLLCGEIRGLQQAMDVIADTIAHFDRDDDD